MMRFSKSLSALAVSASLLTVGTAFAQDADSGLMPIDPKRDHILGSAKATISLVEYSDFECPFCKRHHPVMQKLVKDYEGDVNWVYRHFPLAFHPNAFPAAVASECAAQAGGNEAFWAMTGLLMRNSTPVYNFRRLARQAGLRGGAFNRCLRRGDFAERVREDYEAGVEAGVQGTPMTFLVNNVTGDVYQISGAHPYETFVEAIDDMLSDAEAAR